MVNSKAHQKQLMVYKFQVSMMIKICENPCQTFTRDEISVDNDEITKPGQLKQWKYLEPVVNQLNFERKYISWTTQKSKLYDGTGSNSSTTGQKWRADEFRTRLGWCVVGPVSGTRNSSVSCNKIAVRQADTNQVAKHFFQSKKEVKENDVTEILQEMYNHEFTESQDKLNRETDGMSQEDLKLMKVLDNGTRLIDGHYEIPLPLRDDNVRFPNLRLQTEKIFTYLLRKMSRNHQFKKEYMFMKEMMPKCFRINSSS